MGHPQTIEARIKIGNASRGRRYPGHKRSEEWKRKMSIRHKGHPPYHTPEGNQKISSAIKILWQNPEYRERMILAHQGYQHSEEQKRKIGLSTRRLFRSPEGQEAKEKARQAVIRRFQNPEERLKVSLRFKGRTSPTKGTHWPEEQRKMMSKLHSGSGNPSWRGGIGQLPYNWRFNKALKNYIRARDNYICQLCGIRENGRKHCSHHYKYNKGAVQDELILLCQSCNGKVNFNREFWTDIFSLMVQLKGGLPCPTQK